MQAGAYREAVSPGRADSCACIDFYIVFLGNHEWT